MRAVFGLVLLVGMGLAGFAVYMVSQYMDQQASLLEEERQKAAGVVSVVDVYSPNRDLTYGERLTKDDVVVIPYSSDHLPEGVFHTEEELFPEGTNVPRVVTVPIRVNEPIVAAKVTRPGAPQGITALLDTGMRAFPLDDRITEAFAGELRISDLIDIFWVGNAGGSTNISRLVKSRLEIIAIEEPDSDGNGGGRGVVVQVSPEDFADLNILRSGGTLSLTPVGRDDDIVTTEPVATDINTVLGIEDAPAPEVEVAPEICYRTERRGVEIVQLQTVCD